MTEIQKMKQATAKAKNHAEQLEKEKLRIVEQQKEIIQKHLTQQTQGITNKLQQVLMEQLEQIGRDEKRKYKRMEDFLRDIKYSDGSNGLDRFNQKEQEFEKKKNDELKKNIATSLAMYERIVGDNISKDMENIKLNKHYIFITIFCYN